MNSKSNAELDPAYTDGPFYYCPMPINAEGHGPEMDTAKVVRIQHEVWNGHTLSIGVLPSEAMARWVADRLNAASRLEAINEAEPGEIAWQIANECWLHTTEKAKLARRIQAALFAHTPPAGHVVVPVEPTKEMVEAWYGAVEITRVGSVRGFVDGYRAMLAALPHNQGGAK